MKHPLHRRIIWHPLTALTFTAYAAFRLYSAGPSVLRIGMLTTACIWLIFATADLLTRHRLLDWMYSRDEQ